MLKLYDFEEYPLIVDTWREIDGQKYTIQEPVRVGSTSTGISKYDLTNICNHIGSVICNMVGVKSQKTLLGYVKGRACVACEYFLDGDETLYSMSEVLEGTGIENQYGEVDLNKLLFAFQYHGILKSIAGLERRFWDMFVMDAFLGNMNRTLKDWGILKKIGTNFGVSPIYNNDSCLNSTWEDSEIFRYLTNQVYLFNEGYKGQKCKYTLKGERVNPYQIIASGLYDGCTEALARILPRIDLNSIIRFLREIPMIDDMRLEYYAKILWVRYSGLLKPAYDNLVRGKKEVKAK